MSLENELNSSILIPLKIVVLGDPGVGNFYYLYLLGKHTMMRSL